MKYTLTVETTPEETVQVVTLLRAVLSVFRQKDTGAEFTDFSPAGFAPPFMEGAEEADDDDADAEAEAEAEADAVGEWFVAREARQGDTPPEYGEPLEFRVRLPRNAEESERAWKAWSDFLEAWCAPFSADEPEESAEYPDRARLMRSITGTPVEGQIKQQIAQSGSVNKAVLLWLVNYSYGPDQFSSTDLSLPMHDLADKIAGSFAQLASLFLPEMMVMYDISTSWRTEN